MLTFDVDGVSGALNRNPDSGKLPSFMSVREYGPSVATPRILDMLDVYGIKATFYVPGYVAETHIELVEEIARNPSTPIDRGPHTVRRGKPRPTIREHT